MKVVLQKLQDGGELYKADIMPFLFFAVINKVKHGDIKKKLKSLGFTQSERTIRNWCNEARVWLGLPTARLCTPAVMAKWHRVNGFPDLEALYNGWIPNEVDWEKLPGTSGQAKITSPEKALAQDKRPIRGSDSVPQNDNSVGGVSLTAKSGSQQGLLDRITKTAAEVASEFE